MKKTLAVLSAAVLTLSACGGGDETTAKENIKKELLADASSLTGDQLTEEQADCMSGGLVDEVGVERLQEYGLLDDNLAAVDGADNLKFEAGDADAFAGVVTDCVDVTKLFADQMASEDLSEEQQQCVTDALDEAAIRDILSSTFQGEEPDMGGAMGDAMACVMGGGEGMVIPDEATE